MKIYHVSYGDMVQLLYFHPTTQHISKTHTKYTQTMEADKGHQYYYIGVSEFHDWGVAFNIGVSEFHDWGVAISILGVSEFHDWGVAISMLGVSEFHDWGVAISIIGVSEFLVF